MLKLFFYTITIFPLGLLPLVITHSDQITHDIDDRTYVERITDPNIASLESCGVGELPIFFDNGLVTTHSAEFIHDGLEAAQACGYLDVTIIPILPEDARETELMKSVHRTAELRDYLSAVATVTEANIDMDVAKEPREDTVKTLYINGQAAILKIDPKDHSG